MQVTKTVTSIDEACQRIGCRSGEQRRRSYLMVIQVKGSSLEYYGSGSMMEDHIDQGYDKRLESIAFDCGLEHTLEILQLHRAALSVVSPGQRIHPETVTSSGKRDCSQRS